MKSPGASDSMILKFSGVRFPRMMLRQYSRRSFQQAFPLGCVLMGIILV